MNQKYFEISVEVLLLPFDDFSMSTANGPNFTVFWTRAGHAIDPQVDLPPIKYALFWVVIPLLYYLKLL